MAAEQPTHATRRLSSATRLPSGCAKGSSEDVLPARFGGTPLDYQLLEEEDEKGLTRLNLLVNPRVAIPDEGVVVETVLEGLHARLGVYWREAGTIRVMRKEPVWTGRGKLMPLNLKPRAIRERPS